MSHPDSGHLVDERSAPRVSLIAHPPADARARCDERFARATDFVAAGLEFTM
jgi:hypothetical protein